MVTLGSKFQAKAQEIIAKFSEELGLGKIIRVTGETYDTTTGVYTPTTDETEAYIAFDEIKEEYQTSEFGAEYIKNTMLALIAGADLTSPVEIGDYIQRPGSAETHKVIFAPTDQYGALYSCHITRKVEVPSV